MKKISALVLVPVLVLALVGCFGDTTSVTVHYGSSELYTMEDIDHAVSLVKKEFRTFRGCELHSLSYAGDERSTAELDSYNSRFEFDEYVACIVLDSSFHSPKNGGGAWIADTEYTWSWILLQESDGDWFLLTYGYA